jgi:hypothetical protein
VVVLAITFDIDWAPDWAVALCGDICAKAGSVATFFVTHKSDVLAKLQASGMELGVHPNFLPNSTHGRDVSTVLNHILGVVPQARCMRTHSLVQSTPIFAEVVSHTNIETDVSLLLPLHKHLKPVIQYPVEGRRPLLRLPYFWEDDLASFDPIWDWASEIEHGPDQLEIYDFHPIHIALNLNKMDEYRRLKSSLNGKPLSAVSEHECAPFIHPGEGARTYLERLLKVGGAAEFRTISQIAHESGLL